MQVMQQDRAKVTNPRFKIDAEADWTEMQSGQRTVQRFKKIYLQSEQFEKTKKRLDVLQNIEVIDASNTAQLEEYKRDVDQQMNAKVKKAQQAGGEQSKTVLPTKTTIIPVPTRLSFAQQFIMEALVMSQFDPLDIDIDVTEGVQTFKVPIKAFISDYTGWRFGIDMYWKGLGWALLFIVVVQIIAFVTSTYVVHQKR